MTATKKTSKKAFRHLSMFFGGVFVIWSSAAMLSALAQVNWQFSELLRQYLIAIGVMKEFHTFVDFYTHIKGVEYIICASFLIGFPSFYKYINRPAELSESA